VKIFFPAIGHDRPVKKLANFTPVSTTVCKITSDKIPIRVTAKTKRSYLFVEKYSPAFLKNFF
jgi:hypothetical protein